MSMLRTLVRLLFLTATNKDTFTPNYLGHNQLTLKGKSSPCLDHSQSNDTPVENLSE